MKTMHMMQSRREGAQTVKAFLQRTAMWRLPECCDEWMFRCGKQFAGGLERVGERASVEFVANGDAFFRRQIGAAQGVLDDLVAPCCIGIRRSAIACPHADRLGLKSNGGIQHG